ncbi:MAG TPA: glycosyltransferase family A protein, partial [Acetobacteraceae bacterium]|nr:glycosyltransferase family A protein [Acetobacteraceae bacterium]
MPGLPFVDVTLFVHNGAATVSAAIESVLAQTWPALSLTLIDDGSTDATAELLAAHAARDPAIRTHRIRRNGGAVAAFQRGFWFGDADFLLPKSADDLIAPDFVERCMAVLLAHPD